MYLQGSYYLMFNVANFKVKLVVYNKNYKDLELFFLENFIIKCEEFYVHFKLENLFNFV